MYAAESVCPFHLQPCRHHQASIKLREKRKHNIVVLNFQVALQLLHKCLHKSYTMQTELSITAVRSLVRLQSSSIIFDSSQE
jgi:hypothetical protein